MRHAYKSLGVTKNVNKIIVDVDFFIKSYFVKFCLSYCNMSYGKENDLK